MRICKTLGGRSEQVVEQVINFSNTFQKGVVTTQMYHLYEASRIVTQDVVLFTLRSSSSTYSGCILAIGMHSNLAQHVCLVATYFGRDIRCFLSSFCFQLSETYSKLLPFHSSSIFEFFNFSYENIYIYI